MLLAVGETSLGEARRGCNVPLPTLVRKERESRGGRQAQNEREREESEKDNGRERREERTGH